MEEEVSEILETNTLQGSIEISHDVRNESSEKSIISESQSFDDGKDGYGRETFDVDAEIDKLSQEMNSMPGSEYEDSRLFDEASPVEEETEQLFDFRD